MNNEAWKCSSDVPLMPNHGRNNAYYNKDK